MISVVIFAVDAKLRCRLEQVSQRDAGIAIVGIADDQRSLLKLADRFGADVVLTQELPADEAFAHWRERHKHVGWVLFLDPQSERAGRKALGAGVSAILPPSADLAGIIATIRIVAGGLAVFPQKLLATLYGKDGNAEIANGPPGETETGRPQLSKRERAVLTAMTDGLSNKQIARRLGISFHTVKFHVASILEKLDVDTRTEAVIKAAQLGLVML
jgi:two-component system, NarL family, response regulator YdfI